MCVWHKVPSHARAQIHLPAPDEWNVASVKRAPGQGRPAPRAPNQAPQAGPRQYEPAGKRYSIDRNAVSYMGWTFQVRVQVTAF